MHAFDLDAAGGHASSRSGAREPARRITTLDGVDRDARRRTCSSSPTRAARRRSPASWAAPTRRSTGTTRLIALESAYFKPASVRRTSKRLGLKTEASSRFERGADIDAPGRGARSARLALLRADRRRTRRPARVVDRYPAPRGPPRDPAAARAHRRAARRRRCPTPTSSGSCAALGLRASRRRPTAGTSSVPTFRVDVAARGRSHRGGRPPLRLRPAAEPTFPALTAPPPPPDPRIARDRLVRRVLTAAGLSRSGHVRLHRGAARPRRSRPTATRHRGDRQPAVGEVRRAAAVAPARARRRGRAQPPARPATTSRLFEIGARFHARRRRDAARVGLAWTGAAARRHWSAAPRDRSTSSTSRASSSGLRAALGVPRRVRRRQSTPLSGARPQPARGRRVGGAPVGVHRPARRRRSPRRAGCRARTTCSSPSSTSIALAAGASRRRDRTRSHAAAALSRPSSATCRSSSTDALPAEISSWHHSGGRAGRRSAGGDRVVRSLSGQGRAGRARSACRCGSRSRRADRTLTDAEVQQALDSDSRTRSCATHGAVQR